MVHESNEQKRKENGSWFMIQTNMNGNGNNHLTSRPPTVLLENGSMVHDSNKRGQKRSDCAEEPLENCSMTSWIKPNSNTAKRSVKKERLIRKSK